MNRNANRPRYRLACNGATVLQAMRLVYRRYCPLGYCRPNRYALHTDLYDLAPATRTIVAYRDRMLVGTQTVIPDSSLGLPSEKLYPAEVAKFRAQARQVAECSKFAIGETIGRLDISVGLTYHAIVLLVRVLGASDLLAVCEPHHAPFYTHTYGFEVAGPEKPDPDASGARSLLLRLDLDRFANARHHAVPRGIGRNRMYRRIFESTEAARFVKYAKRVGTRRFGRLDQDPAFALVCHINFQKAKGEAQRHAAIGLL
ncbi:MAG: hypothetical protein L6R28_07545 [Planctomycetes bacterium]|nr:hypothetical protein [Planctomycetota bacterium]